MKAIKKDLHSVVTSLKALLKKTERMERALDKVPTSTARKGRSSLEKGMKPARQGDGTAMIAVYSVIKRSRRGADTTQIRSETGFDSKKIWNAINRLKTQRKIKNARRGLYVAI